MKSVILSTLIMAVFGESRHLLSFGGSANATSNPQTMQKPRQRRPARQVPRPSTPPAAAAAQAALSPNDDGSGDEFDRNARRAHQRAHLKREQEEEDFERQLQLALEESGQQYQAQQKFLDGWQDEIRAHHVQEREQKLRHNSDERPFFLPADQLSDFHPDAVLISHPLRYTFLQAHESGNSVDCNAEYVFMEDLRGIWLLDECACREFKSNHTEQQVFVTLRNAGFPSFDHSLRFGDHKRVELKRDVFCVRMDYCFDDVDGDGEGPMEHLFQFYSPQHGTYLMVDTCNNLKQVNTSEPGVDRHREFSTLFRVHGRKVKQLFPHL